MYHRSCSDPSAGSKHIVALAPHWWPNQDAPWRAGRGRVSSAIAGLGVNGGFRVSAGACSALVAAEEQRAAGINDTLGAERWRHRAGRRSWPKLPPRPRASVGRNIAIHRPSIKCQAPHPTQVRKASHGLPCPAASRSSTADLIRSLMRRCTQRYGPSHIAPGVGGAGRFRDTGCPLLLRWAVRAGMADLARLGFELAGAGFRKTKTEPSF